MGETTDNNPLSQTRAATIRNFCIIAHIDHGKSTLADRMLELTGTIEKRKMREQVLDSMELERERGITIKMTPVRMLWHQNETATPSSFFLNEESHELKSKDNGLSHSEYILNLIDTPGHIDFAYEVSRAMRAVEGAIMLVDATQGVEAQTISVLGMARAAGLAIIPAVNKIDSPLARVSETKREVARLVGVPENEVLEVSGKTGAGVPELLAALIERIPPPKPFSEQTAAGGFRGLVFDFKYSNHAGVIVYLRVFDGTVRAGDRMRFAQSRREFSARETGVFTPDEAPVASLSAGEIGYLMTGIKSPGIASIGDTVLSATSALAALPGYERPAPVVWASVFPESQDDFAPLKRAIDRLRLSDSSFSSEEESGGLLGRGFRLGFLGMLHLEIVTERLRREFGLSLVVTMPSITYEVVIKSSAAGDSGGNGRGKRETVYSAARFPDYGEVIEVFEPWVEARIITPAEYLPRLIPMLYDHEAHAKTTEDFGGDRNLLIIELPLRELMRGFFDEVKSVSSGFASFSYQMLDTRSANVVKLELLVAEEVVPAFSRIVARARVETEAEAAVEKLHSILPRQLFACKVQAQALGRIISSRTLRALSKDVTGYLYGGDRTRKMKLWQQQQRGKKRLKEEGRGRVRIPHDVFVKMVQS